MFPRRKSRPESEDRKEMKLELEFWPLSRPARKEWTHPRSIVTRKERTFCSIFAYLHEFETTYCSIFGYFGEFWDEKDWSYYFIFSHLQEFKTINELTFCSIFVELFAWIWEPLSRFWLFLGKWAKKEPIKIIVHVWLLPRINFLRVFSVWLYARMHPRPERNETFARCLAVLGNLRTNRKGNNFEPRGSNPVQA